MSATQWAFVALKYEEMAAIEAEKRRLATLKQNATVTEKIPERSGRGEAREKAAKATGVNAHYASDAKKLAKQAPDVAEAAKAGKLSMSNAKAVAALPPDLRDICATGFWKSSSSPRNRRLCYRPRKPAHLWSGQLQG